MDQKITSDTIKKASGFSFIYLDRKYSKDLMHLWESTAEREASQ